MPRYLHHLKAKKEKNKSYTYIYFLLKIIFAAIIIFFFSKNKPLIWIIIFEFIDIWRNIIQRCMPQIPLNIEFIFGVMLAYFFNPIFGIIIFLLAMINKIAFFAVNYKHFIKGIRYIILFLIIPYLRFLNFYYTAMIIIVLNYLAKYTGRLIIGNIEAEDSFYDAVNFLLSTGVFYLIYMMSFYLPILF